MLRTLLLVTLAVLLAGPSTTVAEGRTVVYVVRHAEKAEEPRRNPGLTPAGEELGTPVVLTSRVTALTGLGQLLTVGFILVLVTWWVSHWRKRRRESLADEAADVAARHPSSGNHEPAG